MSEESETVKNHGAPIFKFSKNSVHTESGAEYRVYNQSQESTSCCLSSHDPLLQKSYLRIILTLQTNSKLLLWFAGLPALVNNRTTSGNQSECSAEIQVFNNDDAKSEDDAKISQSGQPFATYQITNDGKRSRCGS